MNTDAFLLPKAAEAVLKIFKKEDVKIKSIDSLEFKTAPADDLLNQPDVEMRLTISISNRAARNILDRDKKP